MGNAWTPADDDEQPFYELGTMAYQFVLNKYTVNDDHHIDPHRDESLCYHSRYPITSLSYGHGAEMTLV